REEQAERGGGARGEGLWSEGLEGEVAGIHPALAPKGEADLDGGGIRRQGRRLPAGPAPLGQSLEGRALGPPPPLAFDVPIIGDQPHVATSPVVDRDPEVLSPSDLRRARAPSAEELVVTGVPFGHGDAREAELSLVEVAEGTAAVAESPLRPAVGHP